jgi:putative transposase
MSAGGYKISNQNAIHFITFAVVEWVDVFTRKVYKDILISSLKHCQKTKGLSIHAWVFMSNHVHFVLSAKEGFKLSDILRDFKKFTSSEILQTIENIRYESRKDWMLWIFKNAGRNNDRNVSYQFWQQDNRPVELDTNKMIDQRLEYIHNNPVEAGIVGQPEDYLYSSAKDYSGLKGLLNIAFIDEK